MEPVAGVTTGSVDFHHVSVGPGDEIFVVGEVTIHLDVCLKDIGDGACDATGLCDYGNHFLVFYIVIV